MSKNKTNNRNGVRNRPIISTILVFEIDRIRAVPKKRIENQIGEKSGRRGCIPISKVVAPVRGKATSGPIHNMMSSVSSLTRVGCNSTPKSVNCFPTFDTISTPKKGASIAVIKSPMSAQCHSYPTLIPIKGGKIRLPAPKNIAKRAKPTVVTVVHLCLDRCFITSN